MIFSASLRAAALVGVLSISAFAADIRNCDFMALAPQIRAIVVFHAIYFATRNLNINEYGQLDDRPNDTPRNTVRIVNGLPEEFHVNYEFNVRDHITHDFHDPIRNRTRVLPPRQRNINVEGSFFGFDVEEDTVAQMHTFSFRVPFGASRESQVYNPNTIERWNHRVAAWNTNGGVFGRVTIHEGGYVYQRQLDMNWLNPVEGTTYVYFFLEHSVPRMRIIRFNATTRRWQNGIDYTFHRAHREL